MHTQVNSDQIQRKEWCWWNSSFRGCDDYYNHHDIWTVALTATIIMLRILNTDFIPWTVRSLSAQLSSVQKMSHTHTYTLCSVTQTHTYTQHLYGSHSACQIQIGLSCKKWQKHVYQRRTQTIHARNIIWLIHGQVLRWRPLYQILTRGHTTHTNLQKPLVTRRQERRDRSDETRLHQIRLLIENNPS